jgi:LCP family protein required for cell wall assembly
LLAMDDYDNYEPIAKSTQPITRRVVVGETQPSRPSPQHRRWGCSRLAILIALLLAVYFFAPFRTNVLVLGIDRAVEGTDIGRSDTIMLVGIQTFSGKVNMLSIPRDLWVPIPGYGESRINSAHSWGEGEQAGGGPRLAAATVRENFDVGVNYYLRVRLEEFAGVIDAMGGIDITLEVAAAGYPAGTHHLDGTQALAFVRNRDGDDFYRQQHQQIFILALGKKMINPLNWLSLPTAMIEMAQAIDTNIPFWSWPRLMFAMLRAVIFGSIETVVLPRDAVTPWVTDGGAQVLLPNWDLILPVVRDLFGIL